MAKLGKRKTGAADAPKTQGLPAESGSSRWWTLSGWRPMAVLAFAVLIFYWIPLTDASATVQWDAVDVHYSSQKYFSDHVLNGELPFWTPYIFAGFPFLADIQVGAWYPLNWPFFLAGITPRMIQLEVALHAFLACAGAFLLLTRLVRNRWGALVGAILYGFSGYFADHSSHVGMFCAASLMPWLLLCFDIAMERSTLRFAALGGLIGGAIILIEPRRSPSTASRVSAYTTAPRPALFSRSAFPGFRGGERASMERPVRYSAPIMRSRASRFRPARRTW
jgi:hypothetical protein